MPKNTVTYEWDVEELEEAPSADNGHDPDIYDHHFCDTYAEARHGSEQLTAEGKPNRIVLVRNEGNDVYGIVDRAWAYLTVGALPQTFTYGAGEDSGIAVPQRFHTEVTRWARKRGIVPGAIVAFNDLDDATWFDVLKIDGLTLTIREHGTAYREQTMDMSLVAQLR